MVYSLVLLTMLVSAPFEEPQRRFHVTLPPHWEFTPQPGDTFGAVFRRQSEGLTIHATVRVVPLPAEASLPLFAAHVRQASESEPGYRSLDQRSCAVAELPGECRRFVSLVNGDPRLAKMVEQRIAMAPGYDATGAAGHYGFVLHAESLAEAFAFFEPDVLALFDSFAPGPLPKAEAVARALPTWNDVLGRWVSQGGHRLTLTPGGTIVLDGHHGTYELGGASLTAQLEDGTAVFELDSQPGLLVLSGGMFGGEGERFVRPKAARAPGDRAHRTAKKKPQGVKAARDKAAP